MAERTTGTAPVGSGRSCATKAVADKAVVDLQAAQVKYEADKKAAEEAIVATDEAIKKAQAAR